MSTGPERVKSWLGMNWNVFLQKATKRVEKPSAVTIGESLDDTFGTGHKESFDFDGWSEGWRQDDTSHHFIQFIFLEHHFEMDLPRPML
jgi:hypothetical protein